VAEPKTCRGKPCPFPRKTLASAGVGMASTRLLGSKVT